MTKFVSAVLFIAACLSVSCFGVNLIANPGFEDGNSTAWSGRGATLTITTEQKHSGEQSAKASNRTDAWQGIKQSILDKVKNGKTYQVVAWVRLENAVSDNVIISIEKKDDTGTNYQNVISGAVTDSNWVRLEWTFTMSSIGTPTVLDVYFEGPKAGVNFYIDDVEVVDIDDLPQPGQPAPAQPPAAPAAPDKPAEPAKPAEPNAAVK